MRRNGFRGELCLLFNCLPAAADEASNGAAARAAGRRMRRHKAVALPAPPCDIDLGKQKLMRGGVS
jgi:hypothetical protein